jgi:hypothetical protein
MLYDLRLTVQDLRDRTVALPASGDVTLTAAGKQITVTCEQLTAVAAWAEPGDDMADVFLLVDDRMLLAEQGDDRTAFDTGGEPGSDEYLAVAPLSR